MRFSRPQLIIWGTWPSKRVLATPMVLGTTVVGLETTTSRVSSRSRGEAERRMFRQQY